jgi:hypothetical protein
MMFKRFKMKKTWMIFLLMPILNLAAYPIYDEEIESRQEQPKHDVDPSLEGRIAQEYSDEEEPMNDAQEEEAIYFPQRPRKQLGAKNRYERLKKDQKTAKATAKPTLPSIEDKQAVSAKSSPIKRNSNALQSKASSSSKFRNARQNPNRPQVIQRDGPKKQPQNLPQIEADAEDIEAGLSTHHNDERIDQEIKPSQKEKGVTAQKNGLTKRGPKAINEQQDKSSRQTARKTKWSHPGKRAIEG